MSETDTPLESPPVEEGDDQVAKPDDFEPEPEDENQSVDRSYRNLPVMFPSSATISSEGMTLA
jgi:hypothetical protein